MVGDNQCHNTGADLKSPLRDAGRGPVGGEKKAGNPGHIQLADAKVTINIDQLVIQDCVTANQYPDLAFLLSRREGKGDSIAHKGARSVI